MPDSPLENSWRLYYLTTARIPGEKAHSIQIIKNFDYLKSNGCDIKLIIAKKKNFFKISNSIEEFYSLKNPFLCTNLFCISGIHLSKNLRLQSIFQKIMNLSFSVSSILFLLMDKTKKQKIIFIRHFDLLKTILPFLKLFKLSIIFEMHELPKNQSIKNEISLYKKCEIIITTSQYQREKIISMGLDNKKVISIQNGFDETYFQEINPLRISLKKLLDIPAEGKIIMYAGNLEEWKSVDFIINSIRYTNDDIYLIIIGGTDKEIQKYKQKFPEIKRIRYLTRVPHKEVPSYLIEADALVLYRKPSGPNVRGYSSLKLFEYMASGKPILVPNLPWLLEVIQNNENGVIFDPNNEEDLARKANYLLKNIELQKRIGKKTKEDSRKYSLNNRTNMIINLINEKLVKKII